MGDFHPDAHVKGLSGCNLIALICSRNSATCCSISVLLYMAQKYRIYINEKVILLTESLPPRVESYEHIDGDIFDLRLIYNWVLNHHSKFFYVLCKDAKAFLKKVTKSLTLIRAAGGLVVSE